MTQFWHRKTHFHFSETIQFAKWPQKSYSKEKLAINIFVIDHILSCCDKKLLKEHLCSLKT